MSDLFTKIQNAQDKKAVEALKKDLKDFFKSKKPAPILGENKDSLLHVAARFCPGIISTLLKNIDVNVQNRHAQRPLHIAAKYNKDSVKKLAKEDDLDVDAADSQGNTPLHYAAKFNQDLVKTMIKVGADANIKNNDGKTPLDLLNIAAAEAQGK